MTVHVRIASVIEMAVGFSNEHSPNANMWLSRLPQVPENVAVQALSSFKLSLDTSSPRGHRGAALLQRPASEVIAAARYSARSLRFGRPVHPSRAGAPPPIVAGAWVES